MRFISSSSSFYYLALGIIFNHQLITNADILHSRGLHHTISHKQLSKTLLKRSNEPIKPPTVLPTVGIKYAEDYQLSQTLAGETFFDGFVFINRWDVSLRSFRFLNHLNLCVELNTSKTFKHFLIRLPSRILHMVRHSE